MVLPIDDRPGHGRLDRRGQEAVRKSGKIGLLAAGLYTSRRTSRELRFCRALSAPLPQVLPIVTSGEPITSFAAGCGGFRCRRIFSPVFTIRRAHLPRSGISEAITPRPSEARMHLLRLARHDDRARGLLPNQPARG